MVVCFADASDSLFATELVKTLVMNFWDEYSRIVIRWVLVPFSIYFTSTVLYFSNNIIDEEFRASERTFKETWNTLEFVNRVITMVFMFYFFCWECAQIRKAGTSYFTDLWNYLDIGSIALNTFLLCDLFLESHILSLEDTVLLCFIATVILWWKMIYWFRLFESTSFYIKLISETIRGIGYFTIIFIFILGAFSNAVYILNANRGVELDEEGNPVVNVFGDEEGDLILDGNLENGAFDAYLNQYMLALGEFGTDNFSADGSRNSAVLWVLFIIATFLS